MLIIAESNCSSLSSHLIVLEFGNICHHERLHELHPVSAIDFGLNEENQKRKAKWLNFHF